MINKNRIAILNFLQWNDKNGSYTDENRQIEGFSILSEYDAIKYFFSVINDDIYYTVTDNIFELTYEEVIKIASEKNILISTTKKLEKLYEENNPNEEFYKMLI